MPRHAGDHTSLNWPASYDRYFQAHLSAQGNLVRDAGSLVLELKG